MVHLNLTGNHISHWKKFRDKWDSLSSLHFNLTLLFTMIMHYIFINFSNPSQYFFGSICFQKLEEKRLFVQTLPFLACQNKTIIGG